MSIDTFDFQRYIAEHRDPSSRSRSLPVGEYAFRGDVRLLRTLHTLAPVRLMVGASMRLWRGWGRKRVLKDATRASEHDAQRVHQVALRCARALHAPPQVIYLAPHLKGEAARALGSDDEVFVAVQPEGIKDLDDAALAFVMGRELGHIQNGHAVYHTAAYYSDELAGMVVRWALTPAVLSLNTWRQRSELTADRAGLLCCQSLEVASRQIVRQSVADQQLEAEVDLDALLAAAGQPGEGAGAAGWVGRLGERLPLLSLRLRALDAFSRSQYYRDHSGDHSASGATLSEVDDLVDEMIKKKARSQPPSGKE